MQDQIDFGLSRPGPRTRAVSAAEPETAGDEGTSAATYCLLCLAGLGFFLFMAGIFLEVTPEASATLAGVFLGVGMFLMFCAALSLCARASTST